MFDAWRKFWRVMSVGAVAALLAIAVACGGGEGDSANQDSEPTEPLEDARGALTATAEAALEGSVEGAAQFGESRDLRFFPDDAETFDLDSTEIVHVTVESLELTEPDCGPDDRILSMCDGSVTPIILRLRIDNPSDSAAGVPDAVLLPTAGASATWYVCPGDMDDPFAGSDIPAGTTIDITRCFGSDSEVSSLDGWVVRVSGMGLVPPEDAEAFWVYR